jgi:hypothetical protein
MTVLLTVIFVFLSVLCRAIALCGAPQCTLQLHWGVHRRDVGNRGCLARQSSTVCGVLGWGECRERAVLEGCVFGCVCREVGGCFFLDS